MATVINNPPERQSDRSTMGPGFVLGVIIAIIIFIFLLAWIIPAFQNRATPAPQEEDVNIQIPDEFDVNVQTPPAEQ